MSKLLEGKNAVVTGGSRGIGHAIALDLAAHGANVLITYLHNDEAASETVRTAAAMGVKAESLKGDVADAAFAAEAVLTATGLLGGLDILVNNAGITNDKLLLRMSPEDFDSVVRTNLSGMFYMIQRAAPVMTKARSGRIINLSSIVGLRGNAGQVNYAAAKAGVIGLTKSVAKELGSRNITANAIAPGLIDTDMTSGASDAQIESALKSISLGRKGTPEDIAHLVTFLASDLASYITGQVIGVDGGMMI
ncbi:MAG: 3-oxoacyl-[acyl-carrier-protein] reductase [Clostridiales Family XIII bacterium]|jgi:3-oxoacyl-[acyl-carrier protein] reductase|nr:3-oxoacyl-[acyl-carrier-protein] reductase [Clostridiales Family XIII bacterium]